MRCKKLSKEVADKLCEPIAELTESEILMLENKLGVELIVVPVEGTDKLKLSRLGLANSFINSAMRGLRLSIVVEDSGEVSNSYFVNYADDYTVAEKRRYDVLKHPLRPLLKG